MKNYLVLVILLSACVASAQSVRFVKGDDTILKNLSEVKFEFRHDKLWVQGMPEEMYITQTKSSVNDKEPGRGDDWEGKWRDDMKQRFLEKFTALFCKYAEMHATDNAAYKIVLNAEKLSPNVDLKAYLTVSISVVESKSDSVVAVYNAVDIMGRASGGPYGGGLWNKYDAGIRIQEAFAKTGKELGLFVKDGKKK